MSEAKRVRVEEFAAAALALRGARFQHLGRGPAGVDCIGIGFAAAIACGLNPAPFVGYAKTPDSDVLLAAVAERCEPREWSEWEKIGRLVVLRQAPTGPPRHFAVSTGDGWAIHCETRVRMLWLRERQELVHSVWLVHGVEV